MPALLDRRLACHVVVAKKKDLQLLD